MTNFFTFAANETTSGSIFYLNSIFGNVGTVLTGNGPGLLAVMFTVFNTAVLAIGTLIITYTTGMSIILTAHEGEMLGKKFHSIWVPLRTVMGIAALVPASTGYSYLQIGMMWFILQGVGAADTLWTTTVNYINGNGSTAPPPPGSGGLGAISMQMGQLFEGLVCQAAEKATGSGYYCSPSSSPPNWCQNTDTLNPAPGSSQVDMTKSPPVYNMGNYTPGGTGDCGTLTLGDPTTLVGQAQNTAFQSIVPTFGAIAAQLVSMDAAYGTFLTQGNLPPSMFPLPINIPPQFVQAYCTANNVSQCTAAQFTNLFPLPTAQNTTAVTNLYWPYGLQSTANNFLTTAANLYNQLVTVASATASQAALSAAQNTSGNPEIDDGWIFAGAYFYQIAQLNRQAAGAGQLNVQPSPNSTNLLPRTQTLTSEATALVGSISSSGGSGPSTSGISISSCFIMFIPAGGLCSDMVNGWMDTLSGTGGNPIVAAQSFGLGLLQTIEIAVPILMAVLIAAGAIGVIVLGNGVPVEPLVIDILIVPLLLFFAGVFLGLGATLAVYTPMIPYMVFAFGAINWIVATIETMIGAPIVAIGLLYPEGGQSELWGKAEAAIMLILNIFLRPSLMIFGMISAMLMSYVAVTYVNRGFLSVVQSIGPYMTFLEAMFFMILYTSLFITVLNKCFELIHVIPDKILRWIGGGQEQFGEGGAGGGAKEVGQGFQAGVQKAEGGMKGAGDASQSYKKAKEKSRTDSTKAEQGQGASGKIGRGGKFTPKGGGGGAVG